MKRTMKRTTKTKRTLADIERITGYSQRVSARMLRAAGLDWRTATRNEIAHAVADHQRSKRSPHGPPILVTVDGVTRSLTGWARVTGLRVHTLALRVRLHGHDAVRLALEGRRPRRQGEVIDPARDRRVRLVEVDGRALSVRAWAAALGVGEVTLHNRVARMGGNYEAAIRRSIEQPGDWRLVRTAEGAR